ncbi:MAG: glycosyltransferase family 2 protein [Acidobacteriaceae bacterium]
MHFRFTIFTPTYNRAHTLPQAYDSLKAQTFRDFEWLIVDDGSSDETAHLVRRWIADNEFSIRYIYQPNQGKHVAFNRGVSEANGELFLTLDSDDTCVPHALERFHHHWESIGIQDRHKFSGVTCLCMDSKGHVVGSSFPNVLDSDPVTMETRYRITGEKWGFHRTEILREFPFPVLSGERFVPEGLIWNRIARDYKIRFINEPLRQFEILPDGLSSSILKIRVNSPRGARLYYREYLEFSLPWRNKVRAAINYMRFSLHAAAPFEMGRGSRLLVLWPFAYLAYRRDRHLLGGG